MGLLHSLNASDMPLSPSIFWISGLPGAGQTTLTSSLVLSLNARGISAFALDSDELRKTLYSDLGLSAADRSENIRRAGEVASLMVQAGITVVCAFVSPFATNRQRVRALFEPSQFVEVFLNNFVQECARRNPKRLYAKARVGHITAPPVQHRAQQRLQPQPRQPLLQPEPFKQFCTQC